MREGEVPVTSQVDPVHTLGPAERSSCATRACPAHGPGAPRRLEASGRLGYIGFGVRICGSVCRGTISGGPQNCGREP